eukprot:jgi/Tetstr1/435858/TSEL_024746.t1
MGRRRVFSDEERAERIKLSKKKWRRDGNRQHIREYRAEYDKANRERVREYHRQYYRANAEHVREIQRERYRRRVARLKTEAADSPL